MSARTFAQINTSLLRSGKLRNCSHSERWAYICAHLTPLGRFAGQFEYPVVMWAQDACIDTGEMENTIHRLVSVGLIEFDFEDEFVRIVGFHRQRPPDNASKVISLAADFYTIGQESEARKIMRLNGAAEFSVAAIQRAQSWSPDSKDRPKLNEALKTFLSGQWQEHGDVLSTALSDELVSAGKATRDELAAIFPPLLAFEQNTMPTPCQHPEDTMPAYEDVDETQTKTRRKKDKEEDGANFRHETPSTASHADSGDFLRIGASGIGTSTLSPREATKRSVLANGGR